MGNFQDYYWLYIIIGLVLFFKFFGKGKGGIVVTRVKADFQISDTRFKTCKPEADYTTFKEGKPHKIDVDIENLPLEVGEALDLIINNKHLAQMTVDSSLEAEFDHWSDEDVDFPQIKAGDRIDIAYKDKIILSGIFRQDI